MTFFLSTNLRPFCEDFRAEPILRTSVGEIDDQLELLMLKGLEGEQDVVNEHIGVVLVHLVLPGNVIEDRVAVDGFSGLVENVECLERFEFVLLMDVLLGHDLFEAGVAQVAVDGPLGVHGLVLWRAEVS